MSENKFIAKLKGEPTPKSVVEIQNDRLVAPFKSSPMGHIADRDSSVIVAKGAQNWAVNQGQLVPVADDYVGTESDLSGTSRVSGAGLWLNATYTFPATGDETNPVSAIIAPSAKWVLTLCGDSLITQNGSVITLTMLVKIGATHLTTKQFKIRECASQFSQRLAIDFSESEQSVIKAHGGSPLTVQVLCDDEGASATIYSGMTCLTLLQRKIDADLVATDNVLLPEFIENLLKGYIIPADYFSNYEYLDQIQDGEKAMPEFTRTGDKVDFTGWAKPIPEVYSKTEIDDKFMVANALIDANADAIQKTREDYIQADSDIMTIVNAHAEQITTNKNDIDDLGNQVAEIEAKIPETASAENPLVTRSEISSVYKFKGSVATYNDLPTGATVGDVYNVTDTGANYAWDGSAWDKLSETVDLSSYATTAYVNAREQDIRSDYMAADSELQTQINGLSSTVATNQSNISILRTDVDDLEGQATANHNDITAHIADTSNPHNVTKAQVGLGNVDNTSDLNKPVSTAQQNAINTAKQDVISGYTTADGELQQQINGQATAISTNTSNITALTTRVGTNETNIALLDSDVDTINTDVATAKTDIANLKSSVNSQAGLIQGLQDDVSGKVDKNQGTANAGKILSVGSDGQVTLSSAPGGGLTSVVHDSTLTGTGANSSPLGIASTVLAEIADKADQTTVETLSGVVSQNTTNISTLRTDVDDLGDQVSGIESKIPASASSTNPLATKSEIPTVPTNISAFNNDRGYITSSALTPYATTQALNNGLATKQPAGDYATNSALTSGLALKVAIAQGAENAGKILKIDDSGNVIVADESGGGASLPILYHTWADHILNNISWLRADTFSWQSGDVYVAAYNHLVADFENIASETLYAWDNGAGSYVYTLSESPSVGDSVYDSSGVLDSFRSVINVAGGGIYVGKDEVSSLLYTRDSSRDTKFPQTDTIGNITITYYLAEDGHKICLPDQESNIVALYEATGVAWYYLLDAENKQFKLPREDKDGEYLYFYVGNFKQSAIEQTAGLNTEMFNDLNAHKVIEFQAPTAANGYTWYRKYADGWVEQGGSYEMTIGTANVQFYISLPVAMANVRYSASVNVHGGWATDNVAQLESCTTTVLAGYAKSSNSSTKYILWQVSGIAAQ